MNLPKRLIEVDLPVKRISAHARREKSIRHGHISTLHIWWARRPLAACRAVICAALWPDPVDVTEEDVAKAKRQGQDLQLNTCPPDFREKAKELMRKWATRHLGLVSGESYPRFNIIAQDLSRLNDNIELRKALLDFIADFANWDNSTVREYLDTSRALTQAAHEALGGAPGTRPLVVDPFAGGGSIPLEALRVGADAFASDLNPVPVLLNKVVLDYVPKYGQRLAEEVRKWGTWIKREAEKELAEFYRKDGDGATPIAYLWARTIQCEGPGCGAEVPLIRSLWLAKRANHSVALQLVPNPKAKRVDFKIIVKERDGWVDQANLEEAKHVESPKFVGPSTRGSATCPCCGYTTPVESVRRQLHVRKGGVETARMFAVVLSVPGKNGRHYRIPTPLDLRMSVKAREELQVRKEQVQIDTHLTLVPDEQFTGTEPRRIPLPLYGMSGFGDLHSARQLLALTTLVRLVRQVGDRLRNTEAVDPGLARAIQTCLAFTVDRQADYLSSLTIWSGSGEFIAHTFGRQALPIVWEWPECNPWADGSGNFDGAIAWVCRVIEANTFQATSAATVESASATLHPLPDDVAQAFVTDPPYYYSVPYADLSDFFYVWLRRMLFDVHPALFVGTLTPKEQECVQNLPHSAVAHRQKDRAFYEHSMTMALSEGRRVVSPEGIGIVVFAHADTDAWESLLNALIAAGWVVTASWPIDTERGARLISQRQSSLASSVHLVCRPRENRDGSARTIEIGDWRDVLRELPLRIHEWMPRLAQEGVVGADAIFACLGPALEIFSRYSRVEKASGETITLKDYLEQVWAAVAKEALSMVFAGADASGFEEDARLTAMWLWTLSPGPQSKNGSAEEEFVEEKTTDDDEEDPAKAAKTSGFILEFDAARKIAQGLGAHLEELFTLVEVKGDKARLLPVAERTKYLFGKGETDRPAPMKKKKVQPKLFQELEELDEGSNWATKGSPSLGDTVLDRIHQTMILFAAGRSEAMRRFLVEDGAGSDERFWRLANALSALYPPNGDEKRWVDGVLAKKKSFGF